MHVHPPDTGDNAPMPVTDTRWAPRPALVGTLYEGGRYKPHSGGWCRYCLTFRDECRHPEMVTSLPVGATFRRDGLAYMRVHVPSGSAHEADAGTKPGWTIGRPPAEETEALQLGAALDDGRAGRSGPAEPLAAFAALGWPTPLSDGEPPRAEQPARQGLSGDRDARVETVPRSLVGRLLRGLRRGPVPTVSPSYRVSLSAGRSAAA